ncbi:hypothetical protein G4G28_00555 [Massilia sp. Dwa41.01b]|uniref:hypothetical protein n=1 Tax=Massilia sp. Dwa41.01b TaxID=2709302 RepID=UPI0016048B16|nr:hypothetical protein [Massilia sp. Dwa41.01b]QNA87334.1 hypothetical protein G4G28_00555 [Massilia sp. Dwa41.01b]
MKLVFMMAAALLAGPAHAGAPPDTRDDTDLAALALADAAPDERARPATGRSRWKLQG